MSETLTVFVWFAATLGHFLLSARIQRRALQPLPLFDEQAFATIVLGIGSLSVALHLAALTAGLSLTSGLVALSGWHLLLWRINRSSRRSAMPAATVRVRGVAEALALTIVTGIGFTWIDVASESARIAGTDAAHYHVPFAVNLALGASPFDLPATPHPYPMAASLLHAWFIVPLGDPLIVDLGMCLPFLLLISALNWIFRLCTGQSGLAWASWIGLVLFSTPLFRSSSLVSADLWFASAFLALAAVLLSIYARRTSLLRAIILGSLSLGLLLGTKTMGSVAAGLLIALYGLLELIRQIVTRDRMRWSWSRAAAIGALAVALVCSAGGVWLVRNWRHYGSPIAPAGVALFGVEIFAGEAFQPSTHLSVLSDLEKDDSYDLSDRANHYARSWIGRWFAPALWLVIVVPVDLAVAWLRRRDPAPLHARALAWLMTAAIGGVLGWLLVGAPWTSLEWTDGMSLRYALPVIALLPLVALVALFPLSWRWYESTEPASLLQGALAAISLLAFASALDPEARRAVHVPSISIVWLGVAAAALLTLGWTSAHRAGRPHAGAVLVLTVLLAGAWAPQIVRRAERERRSAIRREVLDQSRFSQSTRGGTDARGAYYLTLADERAAGRRCPERRFFVLTRFDEPLALQSDRYTNQVFYAARDLARTGRAGPLGPCDYVVTNRSVTETIKGVALVDALASGSAVVEIGEAGSFVVLRRQ